jgi:GT2 family glycosyltransferase
VTKPTFSIIIPTYNRALQLAACLQSLGSLDYPRHAFEVIVVNDGSTAPMEAASGPFGSQLELTLVTQPHAGPAAARNTGARRSRGRFLAFTDDDCAPAPDWLQTLAARFRTLTDHAIGGPAINAVPENAYSATSQSILDAMFAHYNAQPDQARFLASNNLAVPADSFRAVGGFDAEAFPFAAAEDMDFCERWRQRGYGMLYAPEVRVAHTHRLTLASFCRQHFVRGRGAFQLRRARARRDGKRSRAGQAGGPRPFRSALRSLQQAERRRLKPAMLLVAWRAAHGLGFCWESLLARR